MKYLIIGSKGQLGRHFCKILKDRDYNYVSSDLPEIDITSTVSILKEFEKSKPNIVINCAGFTNVEEAEKNPHLAYEVNQEGVRNLSKTCREFNTFLVHYSTNLVFDGIKEDPYVETDITNPINEYGKSKLAGEKAIQEEMFDNYLILRTSWLYGEGTQNFIYKFLKRNTEGKELVGVTNEISTPTSTKLLVDVTLKALEKNLKGIYHLVPSGSASRWDWAMEILNILNKPKEIKKVKVEYFNLLAKLPKNTTLDNSKISKELRIKIPSWKDELKQFITEQNYFDFKL